eukprot:scaffold3848_cov16-Tisochrysis_lutea.AAC.1
MAYLVVSITYKISADIASMLARWPDWQAVHAASCHRRKLSPRFYPSMNRVWEHQVSCQQQGEAHRPGYVADPPSGSSAE